MARELRQYGSNIRLTETGGLSLAALSKAWGQSKASVVERLVREAVKKEGIDLDQFKREQEASEEKETATA